MKKIKLKEIFEIKKGKKVEPVDESFPNKVRYIQIEDLRDDRSVKYCFHDDNYVYANSESIIIAWDGANAGTVSYGLEGAIGSTLAVLEAKTKDIYIPFVGKFLQSKFQYLRDTCTGATIPHISRKALENLLIPMPSFEEQVFISKILDKAQSLVERRKAQIESLDQLTQSVFLEMFGDPIIISNKYNTVSLKDLCINISGGGTPSKSKPEYYLGEIPWVTPKDMKRLLIDNSLQHISKEAIENSSAKIIPKNSVLMVVRSGILKKKLPLAINTREVAVNQDMKAFTVNKELINPEYLLFFFMFYQRKLLGKVRSVTADNLDFNDVKKIPVPVPKIELQNHFSKIFYDINKQKNNFQEQLTLLENNFNSLLQRAFKGELFTER
ncbi:restriction endonuclease subunit S [Caldibacillus sp. 210928-DFI.2.22]|uniref:restriction endonuclease subunit S n=1 Tax=unclassified Caldibacillus TaxID=2641266 RepID=UPI001D06FF77|nr:MULTISPECIES: restriction endonuclease subunit S [unclassified Caldibacillus]MCB7071657.1 restriction endonuclease subunit S [Caldibacillus sp. 210928-DFI.2.22]MCB7075080.1 restriction endonuclease subunit S [Caldibacillus sp. 210928-DFI.2.18]